MSAARGWVLFALLVELVAWFWARSTPDATFPWFRVVAHAGPQGFALVVAAGAFAVGLSRLRAIGPLARVMRSPLTLGLVALVVHLAFFSDIPQGQPDTINYFVQARSFAMHPVATLAAWPAQVWAGPQGRFHTMMPLVPAIYGVFYRLLGDGPLVSALVMTGVAVALPLAVAHLGRAVAGDAGVGVAGGWLALGVPYALAQSGWMLVDLPLVVLLCLTWAAWLRVGVSPWRWGGAVALSLLVLATKISAGLFLLAPLGVLVLSRWGRRWAVYALALAGLLLVVLLEPPHLRRADGYLGAALATALHLRPSLWLLALAAFRMRSPLDALTLGALLTVPLLVLYGPAEHAARYALPLLGLLALSAAGRARRVRGGVPALVVSGLALALVGYRPVVVRNQAVNLPAAVRAIEAAGVQGIAVWADSPSTSFPVEALTGMVDFYARVPVCVGGALGQGAPGHKLHWWDVYEAPAWESCDDVDTDGVLLGVYGGSAETFESQTGPALERIAVVSLYRGSHWLLPREFVLYRDPGGRNDEVSGSSPK